MFRSMLLAFPLVFAACDGGGTTETTLPAPTLEITAPADGATVAAGDVSVSLVIANFELTGPATARNAPSILRYLDPIATAEAHNEEGTPKGYAEVKLDGALVEDVTATQYTLAGVAAGSHTLEVELYFEDGDALEPPVTATVTFTAE